jgi:HNH endonuclease
VVVSKRNTPDEIHEQALFAFWLAVDRHPGTNLEQLIRAEDIYIEGRPDSWEFDERGTSSEYPPATLATHNCWSCRSSEGPRYWHHIIWISHGGADVPRNRVALCRRCHGILHPWLLVPPETKVGRERRAADIRRRLQDLARQRRGLPTIERCQHCGSRAYTPDDSGAYCGECGRDWNVRV